MIKKLLLSALFCLLAVGAHAQEQVLVTNPNDGDALEIGAYKSGFPATNVWGLYFETGNPPILRLYDGNVKLFSNGLTLQATLASKFINPTGTTSQVVLGDGTLGALPSSTRTTSAFTLNVSGTGATGTQVSASKDSTVRVTYSTSVTVTLGGSPVSQVSVKTCATNSSTESDWTEYGRTSTAQPTTLSVTVGGVYTQAGQVVADVPAGYYVKAVNTGSGTHSEAFVVGQKTIY